jgi:TPR repeat protein
MDLASIAAERGAGVYDLFSLFAWAYLSAERGDTDQAERLYRRAIAAGDARAANNLGVLMTQRGNFAEAASLYRQAISAGDTRASDNLAWLTGASGNRDVTELYRTYQPTSAAPMMPSYRTPAPDYPPLPPDPWQNWPPKTGT